MNIKIIAPIIIFAIIAAAVVIFYSNQQSNSTEPQITRNSSQNNSNLADKDDKFDVAELSGVQGYEDSSGMAIRDYNGHTFTHTVNALIPDPPTGKFYEGWLVQKEPSLKFFSTGKLEKIGDTYSLDYTLPQDKSDYPDVVVTLETEKNGLDGIPEAHVLEGTFTSTP